MNTRVIHTQIIFLFLMVISLAVFIGCDSVQDDIVDRHLSRHDDYPKDAEPVLTEASGTYIWDQDANILTFTWITSDFTCNGPELGTDAKTIISIEDTTMHWIESNAVWYRDSGTANEITGAWETYSDENTYQLNMNDDGTMHLTAFDLLCDEENVLTIDGQWLH